MMPTPTFPTTDSPFVQTATQILGGNRGAALYMDQHPDLCNSLVAKGAANQIVRLRQRIRAAQKARAAVAAVLREMIDEPKPAERDALTAQWKKTLADLDAAIAADEASITHWQGVEKQVSRQEVQ